MRCPDSCACGGFGGPVLVSGPISTIALLSGVIPGSRWICHTCKKESPASDKIADHYPGCLWLEDEVAWQNAFANSAGVPVEYPHASSSTNIGKYFWRKALEYERTRKKEKNQWP